MEHMYMISQRIHIYDASEGLSGVTVGHCVGGTLAQLFSTAFFPTVTTLLFLLIDRCDYV